MCYQLIELYSVCRCLYYQHAVDQCPSYGRQGHYIEQREIFVGLACSVHSRSARSTYASPQYAYSDSGYQSGQSHKSSSHRHYR